MTESRETRKTNALATGVLTICIAAFFEAHIALAAPYGLAACGVTEELLCADFWIKRARDPSDIILTVDEANALTEKIRSARGTYCRDILAYPKRVSREEARRAMENFSKRPSSERFVGELPAGDDFWRVVEANANMDALPEVIDVRFAVAVKNCAIRSTPCAKALYAAPDDVLFDMNAESAVKTWEYLAVLHESADGKFLFVDAPYCSGWTEKENVAFCDRETLSEIASLPFYVVTASRAETDILTADQKARREFVMGTRLPEASDVSAVDGVSTLFSRVVLVPERFSDGTLVVLKERLPLSSDVSRGFLPLTEENVIRQAFKMLGERYGWGGTFGARDCSAFARDIYLVFGVDLPRNSRAQTRIPVKVIKTKEMTPLEKEKILSNLRAGALLQMPGHVMLYLGAVGGKPYVIHAVYALGASGGDKEERVTLNCVAVTDMNMTRKDGSTIIESIENICVIE